MSSPTETITSLMDLARDPCISLDSSTKSFFEYDDISISSSVHSMISLETMRKKERKNETKERIRGLMRMKFKVDALQNLQTQEGEGDDFEVGLDESISSHSGLHSCVDSLSLTSAPTTKGIMSVRTLEESLRPNKSMSDLRKLRRRVTIKIKSGGDGTASTSRSSRSSTSGNDHNGLTDDTSETSASSSILDDISLGFSKVHIQEYEVVPGCNPSVSEGPPIELGWAHTNRIQVDLDRYEALRGNQRRRQNQMRIPKQYRKELLLYHGSTKKMIKEATKTAKKHRWW